MTPAVVDTDVVSFLFKSDARAQQYLLFLHDRRLLISFMTEAELEQRVLLAKWGSERISRFRGFSRECIPGSFYSVQPTGGGLPDPGGVRHESVKPRKYLDFTYSSERSPTLGSEPRPPRSGCFGRRNRSLTNRSLTVAALTGRIPALTFVSCTRIPVSRAPGLITIASEA